MLLLTDGTILCRADDGSQAGGKDWWRLSPDSSGSYIKGGWSKVAPMKDSRRYFASAVLADGRVFVAGGEYSDSGSDLNSAEVYEPDRDQWIGMVTPPTWTAVGDAPCCVLADGRLLLGSIMSPAAAVLDPASNGWTATNNKDDVSTEETWTLLPDGAVLTVECRGHPKAEKYLPGRNAWVSAGLLPTDLVQSSSLEIGPAVLLPDGRVFAVGATGHTAFYRPASLPDQPGNWVAGPDFPRDPSNTQLAAKDAPACLLPNGNVLLVVSPVAEGTDGRSYPGPSYFYELQGTSLVKTPDPSNSNQPSFAGRLLLLPTGQALFSNGSADVEIYTPDGTPNPAWHPEITDCASSLSAGQPYTLRGRQLNGLSQGVSYGDDVSAATNYPLVQLKTIASGRVWYCRTFGHSSMGVATGQAIVQTTFVVPPTVDNGPAELVVIANGIPSAPWSISVGPLRGKGCGPVIGLVASVVILLAVLLVAVLGPWAI